MQFEQLGPYRLGKKLGQGGMGAVYAGVDQETGAAAAIKVLSPSLASEEGFRVRFEAEIESLKKLNHPHIVRLYGYGEQAGTLFYAMELVEGTSLEDELRAGRRFDWREVTTIAIKLCRALKHAHDHGVIHRDLKPANLLLTPDGDIKLSDFGIARLFGNTRLTSDGGVLGTAEYMAPEQAEGRAVTDRCDQYSLGGVLYALLAGRPPFRAKSLVEMLQLQRYAEPEPVTRFAPQTPAELTRIIHQLLEKDPQNRFANTLILSRSLEAMERGLSISLSRGDDFVLANPNSGDTGDTGQSSAGDLPPTMTPTQLAGAMGSSVGSPADLQMTEATVAFAAPAEKRSLPPEPVVPSDTSGGRFTKVENRLDDRSSALGEILSGLFAPQTLALIGGLMIVVLGGWYLMQPATADTLYQQIETAAAEGDVESLRGVRPKIEEFLDRFADDPRADNVRGMQDELKQTHPIQRAFVEAKRHVLIDPEVALAKFSALIDVYDDDATDSDVTRHYVKMARQQRDRVQKQIDSYAPEGRKLVESRIARAAEVAAKDPTLSRRIYRGVIELYGEKPWAADLVARARAALKTSDAPTASAQ